MTIEIDGGSTAVVLLSGGLDSTVCMGIAAEEHPNVVAVSMWYGQKHATEVEAARRVAAYYDAEHIIVELPTDPFKMGALTTDEAMPQMTYEEISDNQGISPTYVPFRNGTFLSVATAIALTKDAVEVYAGMHAEDANGWAYPDCTPEFLGAMANAIWVGSYSAVRLITPLMWLDKSAVVRKGIELEAPFGLTLSCYEGTQPPCGTCPTCVSRAHAFESLGIKDPLCIE